MRRHLLLFCAVLASGCSGDDGPPPKSCPIGDLTAAAELQIVNLGADLTTISTTQDSDKVPLVAPPQGGWIVLIGARARNLDGCQVTLTTALVDACDGTILNLDVRPTVLDAGADGWGTSSVTTFGNLPVCPTLTSTRDLNGQPYIVQVAIEDVNGQKASTSMTIVPTCGSDPSRCSCECAQDYQTGQVCTTPPGDPAPEACS